MSSIERAVGPQPTIDFNGRLIVLRPAGRRVMAAIESHLRSIVPDPILVTKAKLEGLNVEVQKALMLEAYKDARAIGELSDWRTVKFLSQPAGWAFVIWQCIPGSENIRYEEVLDWVETQNEIEIEIIIRRLVNAAVPMETELKNSPGQRTKKAARRSLTGNTFTGISLRDMRGRRRKSSGS